MAQGFDTSDTDIQVVFTQETLVDEALMKQLHGKQSKSPELKTTSSDSDDDVEDPSLDKRARSNSVQARPSVRL